MEQVGSTMFFDADAFWMTVLKEASGDEVETIIISSYGLYAGISDTGENTAERYGFKNLQQRILDLSNAGKRVVFLLSESDPIECCPDCPHCKAKNDKRDARMLAHIKHWPNVTWRMTQSSHLKAMLLKRKNGTVSGFTGGRNFTGSNWDDVSLRLSYEDAKVLFVKVMDNIKHKSVPVGDGNA